MTVYLSIAMVKDEALCFIVLNSIASSFNLFVIISNNFLVVIDLVKMISIVFLFSNKS